MGGGFWVPNLLIFINPQEDRKCFRINENLLRWNIKVFRSFHIYPVLTNLALDDTEWHFILLGQKFLPETVRTLKLIRNLFPLTHLVYASPALTKKQVFTLYQIGVNSCFVGENRICDFLDFLEQLWQAHWKRIPATLIPQKRDELPSRAKRILNYIEEHPLQYLNVSNLAKCVNISESHFRSEFKYYFDQNFRSFKRKLLSHYENILISKYRLRPSVLYKSLDYNSVSGFSRSFKNRHGESWRHKTLL